MNALTRWQRHRNLKRENKRLSTMIVKLDRELSDTRRHIERIFDVSVWEINEYRARQVQIRIDDHAIKYIRDPQALMVTTAQELIEKILRS